MSLLELLGLVVLVTMGIAAIATVCWMIFTVIQHDVDIANIHARISYHSHRLDKLESERKEATDAKR